MLTITTNSFESDVLHADKPVLVDFWAQWCPYCRRIAPAFDKVGEQYADILTADALALSRIAKKVYLIHRRDSLRATKVYHQPLMAAPNVEFRWNSTVSALLHESCLTGLRLKDVNTGAEHDLACDGVFVSVGRAPATELFRSELALDKSGYIIADESTRTNLPGVFAAGDVRTKALRQVVTAVSDGAVAVHYAEEYLAENR